jgi:hypothetical protein
MAALVFLAALVSVSCGGGMVNASQNAGASGLTLNTSNVDFGNVSVGGSKASVITLTNASASGGPDVTFSQVTVTGSGFAVTPVSLPIVLVPGQASTVTITFAPKSAGAAKGSLSIVVAGAIDPTTLPLTGTGVGSAQLAVAPSTLSFGSLAVGSSNTLSGTLTAGTSSITISNAAINGQGYSLGGIAFPAILAAGTSISYTVTFTPLAAANSPGSISFVSNAANSPATQSLTGTGTQAAAGTPAPVSNLAVAVAPATLAFGSVAVGSSKNMNGTLTAGSSNIAVSSAAWTGQGYSVSGITFPATVAAGTSVSYTVTFAPQAAGSAPGGISFVSNAVNSPSTQTFTGTGTPAPVQHTVDLSWAASTSTVAGYNVYRGTQSGGPYVKLNSTSQPGTSYGDSTVQSGSTYYYVVTSVDGSSVESAYSNQVTAVIPTP